MSEFSAVFSSLESVINVDVLGQCTLLDQRGKNRARRINGESVDAWTSV